MESVPFQFYKRLLLFMEHYEKKQGGSSLFFTRAPRPTHPGDQSHWPLEGGPIEVKTKLYMGWPNTGIRTS